MKNLSQHQSLVQGWKAFLNHHSTASQLDTASELFGLTMNWHNDTTVIPDKIKAAISAKEPVSLADLLLNPKKLPSMIESSIGLFPDELFETVDGIDKYNKHTLLLMALVKINSWVEEAMGLVSIETVSEACKSKVDEDAINRLNLKEGLRLGFLGDSGMITNHWATGAGYPDIISALLKDRCPGLKLHNAGIGGNKVPQGNVRFDRDISPFKPTHVITSFGGNDSAIDDATGENVVPLATYKEELKILVGRIRAIDAVAILKTPDPKYVFHTTEEAYMEYVHTLIEVAREEGTWLWSSNEIWGTQERTAFIHLDGIHLNTYGHQLLALNFISWFSTQL